MIKYACNAFHAVKISFANEIGALAGELGIDGAEVMDTLCRDYSLNISRAYLKPGFAFGGSCLPKDLRALVYRASRLDLKLPLLESVLPSNNAQLDRAITLALDLPGDRIGVFGLAFKENTDDLRESPVVQLLETPDREGAKGPGSRSAYPAGRDLWQQSALHHERHPAHRQPAGRPVGRDADLGGPRPGGAKTFARDPGAAGGERQAAHRSGGRPPSQRRPAGGFRSSPPRSVLYRAKVPAPFRSSTG